MEWLMMKFPAQALLPRICIMFVLQTSELQTSDISNARSSIILAHALVPALPITLQKLKTSVEPLEKSEQGYNAALVWKIVAFAPVLGRLEASGSKPETYHAREACT